ncbi:MAG TPA: DUF2298 domain-containing protein, partial [Candidatus Saccharimonadales bacterium]|nr:DUF2298 domain-containing protein [Candidatus Saccharimonadales bacterium]
LLVFGIIGFPLACTIFPKFPDKAYPFAKILSLLLISYISWILSSLFKIPVNFTSLLIITIIFGLVSFRIGFKNVHGASWKLVIFEEILFALFFLAMILFRGSNPRIEGIEKFMDFAILNGIHRGQQVPPQDVWFSGVKINYYYFGHFISNTLLTLSRENPFIAYNYLVATIFAFAATAAFSINLALTKNKFWSLFGSCLLVAAGNLDFFYNTVILHTSNYFYAQARSLIPFTINEFPTYSFLIGDLHAHILDIPFVLLFIALVINIFLNKDTPNKLYIIICAICLGSLSATNSWDFFIYTPLLGILLFSTKQIKSAIAIVALALLAYIPFYLNFNPPSGGIAFIAPHNDIGPILNMFGFFFVLAIYAIKKPQTEEDKLVRILILFALLLIVVPEFMLLKDIFFKLNPPYQRANTIFKLWYQAWILLSLSIPYCIYQSLKYLKLMWIKIILLIVILSFSYYIFGYTVNAVKYIIGPKYIFKGLDGSSYLTEQDPQEKYLVDYINKNIIGQPVILEAVGNSYTMESLVSSYTGLPTIVGWNQHELGWRDNWPDIANRMGDVQKLYTSDSVQEINDLIDKYKIKYAIITKLEKTNYGSDAGKTLLLRSKVI